MNNAARTGVLLASFLSVVLLAGCTARHAAPRAAEPTQPRGEDLRLALDEHATVIVPGALPAGAEVFDMVVHFHGAPDVVQRELLAAELKAVLLVVNFPGLSSAYGTPMAEPGRFARLLARATAELREVGRLSLEARRGRLCLSSFSAGYGAIRAILRQPGWAERVDAVYLADSMYAGYVGDGDDRRVNSAHIDVFCDFARAAAKGRKTMVVTHSYLEPGSYAGTHETADAVIDACGLSRATVDESGPGDLRVVSRVARGGLLILGCAGTTGDDHGDHLRNLRLGFRRLPAGR